jgi:hypothetical protein
MTGRQMNDRALAWLSVVVVSVLLWVVIAATVALFFVFAGILR